MAEAWLEGPVEGVPPVFQPVAHALVQARRDVAALAATLPADALWADPGGGAPAAGFHLLHLANALDRLFTYARGESLTPGQVAAMKAEGAPARDRDASALAAHVDAAISRALDQVRATAPATAFDERRVGRSGLPSTVIGLLFHAAEHVTRHVGQCITTSKVVLDRSTPP